MDSIVISMQSDTTIQPTVTSPSTLVFSGQPAGHGPVCTDENYAVIISQGRRPPEQHSATTWHLRWRP